MLIKIAIGGSTWVLILLVILSIFSIALIVEKSILYARWVRETRKLWKNLSKSLEGERPQDMENLLRHSQTPIARVVSAGLKFLPSGTGAMMEAMEGEKVIVRMEIERRLAFLGTLGTNAPFIGLFGTVLGIIHSFKDLAVAGHGGGSVMAGISEALVATAVGLWVAIPAAIFFNVFKKKANDMMVYADSISHLMLSNFHKINNQRRPS